MQGLSSRGRRIAAGSLGGLVLSLVLALVLLHTPPARRYATQQAIAILRKQGIEFDASGLDFNLFSLTAQLNDVSVRSPQAPDLPPLLLAERVRVDLSLWKLMRGTYHIEDGEVSNPRLHLVIDRAGRDNVPRPPASDNTGSPAEYFIDRFRIHGGFLRAEDRRQDALIELPLENLTIDGEELSGNHNIALEASTGGWVSLERRRLELSKLGVDALLEKDALIVRRGEVALGASRLNLAGKLGRFAAPEIDARASGHLDLASLRTFAGIPQRAEGKAAVDLTAKGPLNQIAATLKLDAGDVYVERFRNVRVKAEASFDARTSRARVSYLDVSTPFGALKGTADIALNNSAGQSTANFEATGVDARQLAPALELSVRPASRVTARVAAKWPGLSYEQASGNATIRLAATRGTAARGVVPVSGTITASTQGTILRMNATNLSTMGATINGDVAIQDVWDRRALSGHLVVQARDAASVVRNMEGFLGEAPGSLPGTPVTGAATLNAKLGGDVKSPRAALSFQAPQLRVGTLDGLALAAEANYDPARFELNRATLSYREQTVSASGVVGLSGRQQTLALEARSGTLSIPALASALGRPDLPVAGTASFEAKAGGTVSRPVATLNARAEDLAAYGENFGDATLRANLANDLATLDELRLRKPQAGGDGELQASGTFDLNTKAYNVNASASKIALSGLRLPNGDAVQSKEVSLRASGQGTLSEPAGSAELRLNGLKVREIEAGDVAANLNLSGGRAQGELTAPRYGLRAKVEAATAAPYPGTFEIEARNTDLASLPFASPQPLKGNVSMSVRGSGNAQTPESGEATAQVETANLEWRGQPIRTEGPMLAHYAQSRLTVDRAMITARESRFSLSGSLPLREDAGQGAINVSSSLDLATLPLYLPVESEINATGKFEIEGSIEGTLRKIDPKLSLRLDAPSINAPQLRTPIGNAKLAAKIERGALEIASASASAGPAKVSASGTVPLGLLPELPVELPRREGPAAFTAELTSLSLGTIAALPPNAFGTVSARIEATAARPELPALRAVVTLPELKLGIGSYAVEQKDVTRVRIENAVARVEQFQLTGPLTDIRMSGTAGLQGDLPLNLRLDGDLDAALVNAFTEAASVAGKTELHASIGGTAQQPSAEGGISLSDARIGLRSPRVAVEHLDLHIALAGRQATIAKLEGTLNGGTLSGGGTVSVGDGAIANANVSAKADGVFLDFPEGLKTVSDIALTLSGSGENLTLGGQVNILEGGFTDDLSLDRGILAALTAPRAIDLTEDRNKTLENLRFSVGVNTTSPLVVDNNLARAEVNADLRVLGNVYEPGLSGRLTIAEDGEIRLQERRYLVERGVISFNNERRIEPELDVIANTTAAGYDVRLQVLGEPGKTETTLTSDPSLPEPDILAILITGKTLDQMRGQEFNVARDQVLSYLGGRVGSTIGRGIAGATGLSTVRLEPNLIAAEADPSARLTVGQDITRNLELIYSMDLINSSDQIYVAEYDITKRFTTRGTRQSDGSLRMDFRHDLRFGGIPEPRRDSQRLERRVGSLTFDGDTLLPEADLRKKLKVEQGDRYDFFKVRKGVDRIGDVYRKRGLLESRVRLLRGGQAAGQAGVVDLNLSIFGGPKVDFVFEGIGVPGKIEKRVEEVWASGVFDSQRLEDSREVLVEWLVDRKYLQPKIEYRVDSSPESKRVLFDIQPGPRFDDVKLDFEGITLKPDDLRDIVKSQKLETAVYTKPARVSELLRRYYQEQGFLDAAIAAPRYELDPHTRGGRTVIAINEGPLFKVGSIQFAGNQVHDDATLREEIVLKAGDEYKPVLRENALARLKDLYWRGGYNEVEAEFATARNREAGLLDITVNVKENQRSVVREIVVEGNDKTSETLIRTQIELAVGEPLNLQRLGNSRRNLYRTGAFSVIDVVNERIGEAPAGTASGERPTRLRVKVREIQPFEFKYGGFFDTERGPGVIADLSNRNSLGSARVLGLRARYDSQLREGRLYFSQPLLRRFPVRTIASTFVRQERNPATSDTDPFNVDRIGMSVQQEASFLNNFLLNYGYRLEKSRTFDPGPDALFDIPLRIGSLTATLSRETRDEILDATRGAFQSHALQYSAAALGSELSFVKYFGQYFRYVPLQKPRVELFTNKVERPRLVYAGGVRVGLAKGLGGQEVPLSERFFAGGATTLRGFEQNTAGPVAGRQPLGGEAMLVINNELRTPLFSIFDGVGFVDIGNVYSRLGDFRLNDIRKTAGAGLRVRTPWFLVRVDYGVKLDRRPGETASRIFFSIGQAF